ncbi:MAG: uroporphyrinogen-III synthase [Bacteroidetes bacterium]|nr:uroporphyrinogen-III synthase [Bacteroidota bacterium]
MKIKKILVSQPQPTTEKSPYYDIIDKYSVKIDFRPLIKVEPVSAKEFRLQHINILDYSAIIFNARHGIDHFFRLCEEMRIAVPESMKYFCVSETVALYLQKYIQYRKRKIFFSATGKFPDLVTVLNKHPEEKFLYITSDMRNEETMTILETFKQGEILIGCFGANTAQAVRDAGLRLDLEVPTPGFPSMTMALDNFLKEAKKNNGKK